MYQFLRGLFPGCRIAYSPKGYMDSVLAVIYITEHVAEHVNLNDGQPRLLVMDGHVSHLTYDFLQFCLDHNIFPLVIPSHTSHILQPLDVGLFGPYAKKYSKALDDYVLANRFGDFISKPDFFPILHQCRADVFTVKNIQSAFEATGIHPFDMNRVVRKHNIKPPREILNSDPLRTTQHNAECEEDSGATTASSHWQAGPSTPSRKPQLFATIQTPHNNRQVRSLQQTLHQAQEIGDNKAIARGIEALAHYGQQQEAQYEIEKHEHQQLRQKKSKIISTKYLRDDVNGTTYRAQVITQSKVDAIHAKQEEKA